MWLIMAVALPATYGALCWYLHSRGRFERLSVGAGGAAVAALAVVAVHTHMGHAKRRADVESLAHTIELTAFTPPVPRPVPAVEEASASGRPLDLPPVGSLVAGLERRLAEQPADAKGWALLAQSYAFIGNDKAAQTALRRAVELGADEQALRARVLAARRDRHPADSILQAFGG